MAELQEMAEGILIRIQQNECNLIEEATRGQNRNKEWFVHRAGRITASNLYAVCHTKVDKPSVSLIRKICYPEQHAFWSKQTQYGCIHEKDALKSYSERHGSEHRIKLNEVGLIVHPDYPHFGASPDAIVECDVCGEGCVEVKCPYCAQKSSFAELIHTNKTCLISDGAEMKLNRKHAYYSQVQMQLALTGKKYCDFVVWSEVDFFMERINFDKDFWNSESQKATSFHKKVILPELLAKAFTKKQEHLTERVEVVAPKENVPSASCEESCSEIKLVQHDEKTSLSQELWCVCRKPDDGSKMVMCDNKNCKIKWFHRICLDIKRLPKRFICTDCKKSSSIFDK